MSAPENSHDIDLLPDCPPRDVAVSGEDFVLYPFNAYQLALLRGCVDGRAFWASPEPISIEQYLKSVGIYNIYTIEPIFSAPVTRLEPGVVLPSWSVKMKGEVFATQRPRDAPKNKKEWVKYSINIRRGMSHVEYQKQKDETMIECLLAVPDPSLADVWFGQVKS